MALEVIAGCNDGGGRLIPAGPRAAASAHEDRVLALGVLALGAMEGEDEGMDLLRTFARPMLATSFVLDGIDAMTRPARHAERFERATPLLERAGLPPMLTSDARMLTRACGAVSVMAGLGLATSRAPRTCAAVLAGLNIPLTLVNNPVWAVKGKEARKAALSGLARGGAVGAGLLLAAVDREGRPSLTWRVANREKQRKAIAAAWAAGHASRPRRKTA